MAILLEDPPPLFLQYQCNLTIVSLITSSSSSKYMSVASLSICGASWWIDYELLNHLQVLPKLIVLFVI